MINKNAMMIKYNLGDHGWADVKFLDGRKGVDMIVSYLHDTLAEFITAANLLLKGAPDASVIAMDEPGEHIVHLQVLSSTTLAIEIRWFKDCASRDMTTQKEFEVVFECQDTVVNFSTEIFNNARTILEKHGVEGYKKKWVNHDFPIDGYKRLKSLLKK